MEWIKIKTEKPKPRELVLVSNIKDEWVCCGSRIGKKWYNQFAEEEDRIYPTHWMILPQPPKANIIK
jgi:hypothetical protein